ncbi:hypothetical protein C356_06584 [Cryptococcus neoformans c45]|nr:hypothetical protein C356_06584 [Cryptococcus neoformans var. grubii c45]
MNIRNNRTEARSTSYTDADVFDTKWFYIGFGIVCGLVLTFCMYTLWRGLQRSLWPDKLRRCCCCLGGRDRRAGEEGEEVETKEGRGMSSPERGGEVAGDGYGNGNGRKTVYLTDLRNVSSPLQGENGALTAGAGDVREVRLEPGRQGVAIKGTVSSFGHPASMGSPGQPSGRQSVQQLERQAPSPAAQTRSRPRPPSYPRVGPTNSGWVSNPVPTTTHAPRGLGYGVHGSSSASSAYSWNNAAQPPSARPHTPPTGACYLPAGKYPSPHPPPTIPTPAASVKNTQPPSAGSGHVPMSAPSTPVNYSPRVQFSPLPTPSRGRSASSSSAGSALGVQNGPPRSERAV